ncbi:hypothetical protein [Dyadobacter sp. OTU695]|uniref:hypothetical protein n=1 Tax=Dyadobacter sp. OTU695 TaxID=3043860 RepID=UPI00313D7ED6
MSIYHYTTIKSLALILNSKKIRFTRLDLLDDLSEIDGLTDEFKTLFYVSCWTEDSEENISLWSLYTDMKGIRLEFPNYFFQSHYIEKGDYGYWGYTKDFISPLPIEKIRTDDYFIGNLTGEQDSFYVQVNYTSNHTKLKTKSITTINDQTQVTPICNLLRFKHPIWKFQNESRFFLMSVPLPPLQSFNGDRIEQMKSYQGIGLSNEHKFIDVDIDTAILNNIIVRLHPNCDYADKLIVESLLKMYSSNGEMENSNLDGIFRSK